MEQEIINIQDTSSARAKSPQTSIPFSTLLEILHTILEFYRYKFTPIQQLLPGDENTFLARIARMKSILASIKVDDTLS